MLMHTKGILVMTPESAMVLTGKQALDYSGGCLGRGQLRDRRLRADHGPERSGPVLGAGSHGAIGILLAHYAHAYVVPGERFPRRVPRRPIPVDRDVRDYPHRLDGSGFATVGDIFSDEANPDRKLPFDIRTVMRGHRSTRITSPSNGGRPCATPTRRSSGTPISAAIRSPCSVSSPDLAPPWPGTGRRPGSAGPQAPSSRMSSKKVARAINAASGNRPVVVLANLSGFDGSPDSMRILQLEFGAEIGRAVVNFHGPIVFCVISRYHGGAFVVFSQRAQRAARDHSGRRIPGVGHWRGPGGSGGVRPRRPLAGPGRPQGHQARAPARRRRRSKTGPVP